MKYHLWDLLILSDFWLQDIWLSWNGQLVWEKLQIMYWSFYSSKTSDLGGFFKGIILWVKEYVCKREVAFSIAVSHVMTFRESYLNWFCVKLACQSNYMVGKNAGEMNHSGKHKTPTIKSFPYRLLFVIFMSCVSLCHQKKLLYEELWENMLRRS